MSNSGKDAAPVTNKRKAPRYAISPTFPIKTVLSLADQNRNASTGRGGRVNTRANFTGGKDWPGTLIDLSATGANIHLSLAAVAFPDDFCRVKFRLGSYQLEIPCTVAHFRSYSQYAMCGLLFSFPDPETEKAYFQLLEPVIIGTSFVPVECSPDRFGRHKEQYGGKSSGLLTVWRQAPGGELTSFDFRMTRYGVRWSAGLTELVTYGVAVDGPDGGKESARPVLKLKMKGPEKKEDATSTTTLSEAQNEEVHWLFCLAVSNLSSSVAGDVRKFLQSLVVA